MPPLFSNVFLAFVCFVCLFVCLRRAAYKWWVEALDTILNIKDSLHTWRDIITNQSNPGEVFLNRCGLWGCLLGGVLAANIAQ